MATLEARGKVSKIVGGIEWRKDCIEKRFQRLMERTILSRVLVVTISDS